MAYQPWMACDPVTLLRRYTRSNRSSGHVAVEVEDLDAVAVLGSAAEINALQRDLQGAIGLVLVVLPELAPEVDRRVDPLGAVAPDGVEDQVVEVPLPVLDRGIDGYLPSDELPVMGSSRSVWTVVGPLFG